jgi:hypothetical protein
MRTQRIRRWSSPDPLGLGAVNPGNPQSWNRYAYVMNDPLALSDPTGLFAPVPPPPDPTGISDIVVGIIDLLGSIFSLFGHHHHHVTPHAPAAPPGGYGAGIDPFSGDCIWCEMPPTIPGVGFPGGGIAGIQLPGVDGCDFVECGLTGNGFSAGSIRLQWNHFDAKFLYWLLTLAQSNASPGSTLDNRANALAKAINATGIQSLNNPCTVAAWYAASAVAGAGGAAGANAGEIATTIGEEYPTIFHRIMTWLLGRQPTAGTISAAVATVRAIPAACSKLQ